VRRARRTRYLFFFADDSTFLDVALLLRGEARLAPVRQVYAISILTGDEYPLTRAELDRLLAIRSDEWVEVEETAELRRFAEQGLLVTDDEAAELVCLRRRDECLSATGWNLYGALYHSLTRWSDVEAELLEQPVPAVELEARLERFFERHGPAPPHFHRVADGSQARELPLVRPSSDFYRTLERRATTRVFDRTRPISERDLAVLLYYVFGCHGYVAMGSRVLALRKTSPSGGGLHPIEAYPLVVSVEGLAAGLYHYDVERHALEPLEQMDPASAVRVAERFTCGQSYFGNAGALFVLSARFSRSFWKYRNAERALGVVLMDAAHVSQTFQLVCAELGLGSFVTMAINSRDIDARLGIDGFGEGSLAVVGCGVRVEGESVLTPKFEPYVPRETELPSARE
jgi:putative peptide maturation dehydrogenase